MKKFNFSKRKRIGPVLVILLLIGIFCSIYLYRIFSEIRTKSKSLFVSVKELKGALSKNDIDLLNKKLSTVSAKYDDFTKSSKAIYWASFLPYIADFKAGVEAGGYLIRAAKDMVLAVEPYADLIGFKKGGASFVEKSAEERLQTAVLTLDKVLNRLDTISEDIRQAELRIAKIDENRYPERIGSTVIRDRIANIKEQFLGLARLFVEAKPLVRKLPQIMGVNAQKTYLVLFQNDKELRATGGFITAYAVFRIKNGKISIAKSQDIYSLDATITHPPAPKEILTYHKGVSSFFIRDSNLSPDFPTSVALFNSLYQKSPIKVDYDAVIAIDTKVLVDMLKIFGDTEVRGIRFSAELDKRCDCPQVIYRLLDEIDRPVGFIKEDRKGILGDLMYALFYKAIGFSPSKYWGTLVSQMFKNLQEKHILVYFIDPELQKSIEKLNFAGKISDFEGDYLHINNVNFAGAKANLFTTQSIISKTQIKSDSRIIREVKVEFRNPYPHSDCNLERGGLCLNATLRNWIRFYVPRGATLLSFDGSIKKVQTYEDLGKTVFEGFLQVMPLGKATVTIKYLLPANFDRKNYRVLIQKQPGTNDQKLKIDINGRIFFDGTFDVDKEIKLG